MAQTPALFERMSQSVQADCDRILSEARQEADRILAEGRRAADLEYTRGVEATRAEIELADRRERQRLEAEHEKAFLAVQHTVVEEVLNRATDEIARLTQGPEFGPVLDALLDEVLEAVPGRDLMVLAPPAHVDRIRERLQALGRAELEVQPSPGPLDGVAVQDLRRTFRVSNTLSGRFEAVHDEARKLAQARLFGREGR